MGYPSPLWLEEALKKYRRKLDHVRLRGKLKTVIPEASDKTGISQAQNHRIKMKVKAVLNAEGILSDFHPSYYDYALALDKSQRTLEFLVDRIREHVILRQRWETRGLDPDILDKLDDLLIFAYA